jgi:hypothetical protein
VLRVECTKCGRRGVYYVHKLIEKHGRKSNMMKLEGAARRQRDERGPASYPYLIERGHRQPLSGEQVVEHNVVDPTLV